MRSRAALSYDRLDANFFTAPGVAAHERILLAEAAGTVESVSSVGDFGRVWDPPRFARAYAAPAEPGVPYLRPYDVFDYLPSTQDRLSSVRNAHFTRLIPGRGTLLQTCSGRNLGPITVADDDLAAFALSHDMIRIDIDSETDRHFVLAFLKTPTGQALLRRSRSGSVIDHITTSDVEAVPVPILDAATRATVIERMGEAVERSSSARSRLRGLLTQLERHLPTPERATPGRDGWTLTSSRLRGRLDAAYYDPRVRAAREQVREAGGVRLGDLASAVVPTRYKRYYVGPDHGRPVLSGGQILQAEPVNLRHVSDRSFADPSRYVVTEGMTIMAADGRAQGGQGSAALVTAERDGWLASEHVMRFVPRPGVKPGLVWLSLAAQQTKLQVNALSFGSVIDELNADDVADVRVPPIDDELAIDAEAAWAEFGAASRATADAVAILESSLSA
ncbi:hypothetical protein CHO01_31680 [Cellulomonas hominis]|uniref:Type I restriction modification DNA specificity domain-containing protein n=1 Tax=Cellulomonas hominis TaxID=156981 RepID=A0A511FFU1_9CELL|nr:hypothetical protein CHO01_31680 [Cellulomonas hominis]